MKISNDAQYTKCQAFCSSKYGEIPIRFSDKGFSGGNDHRPSFQRLKRIIEENDDAGVVIVWRFDRIARNVNIALNFLELCTRHNVRLISVAEPLPSEGGVAAQKIYVQLLFINAELQRANIIENINNGLRYKRSQGEYISSSISFGFRLVDGKVSQDQEEAKMVRYVFELYNTGKYGYKKIVKHLTNQGYTFRGKPLQEYHIYTILKCRLYYGEIKGGSFGSYMGKFEPIIRKDVFDQAERIRASRTSKKKSNRSYLLRQKIICPYCSGRLSCRHITAENGHKNYYYYCSNHQCQGIYISAKLLEEEVLQVLREFVNGNTVYVTLKKALQFSLNESKQKMKQSQLKTGREKTAIISDFEDGVIDLKQLRKQMRMLEKPKGYQQISYDEDQLRKLLQLKDQRLQGVVINQVEKIVVNSKKELTGVWLKEVNTNIYKESVN